MNRCKCGSYAINPNLFPRTGKYLELCDVCYFKTRLEEVEQRLAEVGVKLPRWIPVSDGLPDKGQKVIAFYRNRAGFPCQIIAEYIHPRTRLCEDFYDFGVEYEPDYDEETDTEWVKAGWIEHIYNWDDYSYVEVQHDVEFWMPRPEAPVNESGGE